jgi:hypothetical protein
MKRKKWSGLVATESLMYLQVQQHGKGKTRYWSMAMFCGPPHVFMVMLGKHKSKTKALKHLADAKRLLKTDSSIMSRAGGFVGYLLEKHVGMSPEAGSPWDNEKHGDNPV